MRQIELDNDNDLMREFSEAIMRYSLSGKTSSVYNIKSSAVQGVYKDVAVAPGVALNLIDLLLFEDIRFTTRTVIPRMVEMGFSTRGFVQFRMKGHRRAFDNYAGQSYLSFAHGEMDIEITAPGGQHIQIVEAQFDPRVFDEYCRNWGCILPKKLQPYAEYCRESVVKCPCVLPSSMEGLLQKVLFRAQSSCESPLGLEEAVTTLTSALVQYLDRGMQTSGAVLASGDIERVREARHILGTRIENPPSLLELSRMVHLNDYKLKTGFRQAFGCTVHQALVEMRLSKAKELLTAQTFSVSEAAFAVGYANLGDFGIAFRKRYGISPGRIKAGKSA